MEDYREKFKTLFVETSKVIRILKEAQMECLDAYITAVEETMDETDPQE